MLFTLSILIPTVLFWYDNIKNYKKLELINNSLNVSTSPINDVDIEKKYLITNANLSSLMSTPAIKGNSSNFEWLGLRTEYYKRVRITNRNDFYPFRNKSNVINEYVKTTFYHSHLNSILGININPIFPKLVKKYGVYENPIVISNNNFAEEIKDEYIFDGTLITKKELSRVYYNSGIVYDKNLNYTIIGKVNNNSIDPSNCIIKKQDTLNIDEIKNRYTNKINSNNNYLLFLTIITVVVGIIELRKKTIK